MYKIAEKSIFNESHRRKVLVGGCDMAEILDEKQGASLQEGACAENAASSSAATSARIKRMRGWLGVKSTSPLHGYDDGGGGVVYGDGHSGWNR